MRRPPVVSSDGRDWHRKACEPRSGLLRQQHFHELRPVCPVCRHLTGGALHPLVLSHVILQQDDHVVQGILICSNAECQREYPIVDGIPLLIPAIRDFIASQVLPLLAREDLNPVLESILGDCCGPGSPLDTMRQQVSSYVWDHYGDLDDERAAVPTSGPETTGASSASPGAIVRLLQTGRATLAEAAPELGLGRCLDIGCGPGRTTFALAAATHDLVLGVDLNFAMLRVASRVLRTGRVRYDRRRVGMVYQRREFPVDLPHADRVDFWCCDAAALPFAPQAFTTAVALNVLDATPAPLGLLGALADTLAPGGTAILACPYDWSAAVTPVEQWLGGHSQRGPDRGDPRAILNRVFRESTTQAGTPCWEVLADRDRLPWLVRLHDRSVNHYDVHLVVARTSP